MAYMELHGSLSDNLRAAIKSAKRLRGHSVHSDTLEFWRALLGHAGAHKGLTDAPEAEIEALIEELQQELEARLTH